MRTITFAAALAASAALAPLAAQAQAFQEGEDQWALTMIGAEEAYKRGFTGQGVLIGVFDSGIDATHSDLAGQMSGLGYDYATGEATVTDDNGHGTHVSGIIAAALDGAGVHGVAYNAQLAVYRLPVLIGTEAGFRAADAALGEYYDIALDQGVRIFNNSWGWDFYVETDGMSLSGVMEAMPGQVAAWRRAAEMDSVLVFSTGNEQQLQPNIQSGLPYYIPELQPHWLAVTATGITGEIASYANHCGLAAAWCLAAPGGDFPGAGQTPEETFITSDAVGGGVRPDAGTSMAAPHVTGAVAIAAEMFPEANAAGLTRLILTTARDIGAPGVDSVYGWGMLNVGALAQTLDPEAASVFANAGWAAREGQLAVRDTLLSRGVEGRGLWGAAIGQRANHDLSDTAYGARAETVGLVVGADILASDRFRLGMALAQTWTDLEERDGSRNTADVRATTLALIGGYEGDFLFAQGALGIDRRKHRHLRRTVPGTAGTVIEDQLAGQTRADGDGQFAAIKAGARFAVGSMDIRPYAQVTATRQKIDGADEAGADVFNLEVLETEATQYEAGPGVDLTLAPFAIGSSDVSFSAGLAYVTSWGDDDHAVLTGLIGAPILGRVSEVSDGFRANVAASARLAPGLTADAWIGGGQAETTDYISAGIGIRARF